MPLELHNAETRYSREPIDPATPEQAYERRWALALLEEVLQRLGAETATEGRAEMFEALKPWLIGDPQDQSYGTLSKKLGMTEGAVKVAMHRLRKRYRQLLKEEIANTVATPSEVEAELRHLFAILSR